MWKKKGGCGVEKQREATPNGWNHGYYTNRLMELSRTGVFSHIDSPSSTINRSGLSLFCQQGPTVDAGSTRYHCETNAMFIQHVELAEKPLTKTDLCQQCRIHREDEPQQILTGGRRPTVGLVRLHPSFYQNNIQPSPESDLCPGQTFHMQPVFIINRCTVQMSWR